MYILYDGGYGSVYKSSKNFHYFTKKSRIDLCLFEVFGNEVGGYVSDLKFQ